MRAALGTTVVIPASKPETQRALVLASLAEGVSVIRNDLRCVETETMKRNCRLMGATIDEHKDHLVVTGCGEPFRIDDNLHILECLGSGLAARTFTVLGSLCPQPVIITGDHTLRKRPMVPLFRNLENNGIHLQYLAENNPHVFPERPILWPALRRGAQDIGA